MRRSWTGSEDATLTRLYRAGAAVREIAHTVGRSEDAVNSRRRELGIAARRTPAAWSPGEDALLEAATRAGVPRAVLAERLARPIGQLVSRRRMLGLTAPASRPYAVREDAALRHVVGTGGDLEDLARELRRTSGALRLRAVALGLYRPSPRRRWSTSEDAALRDGYDGGLSCQGIARHLPERTAFAVAARARQLGLANHARRWTAAEDDHLRRLAPGEQLEGLARRLARTPEALRQRARKLRVAPPQPAVSPRAGLRWTAGEDELLRLHPGLNPATLAELLGRTDRAVTIRLGTLGLRLGRERSPHRRTAHPAPLTPGEHALLRRELAPGQPRRLLTVARRLDLAASLLFTARAGRRPVDVGWAAADAAAGSRPKTPGTVTG